MVLKPGKEGFAEAIFRKWELDFAVIGHVTDTGRMVLEHKGAIVCDIPLAPLADDAPLYDRPHVPTPPRAPLADVPQSADIAADLVALMASPDIASRRWIWEQYDNKVGANTVQAPGGDAAVVRVPLPDGRDSGKAIAVTTDCNPRYCYADPVEGGKQAIAEAYRNLSAVGATPLAVTNCLNFANPQRPEIMGQIVGCLDGMGQACRALDFPIVSGNVSLYNESKATGGGSSILPTPAIGGVGLMADWTKAATIAFKAEGETIVLIGHSAGHIGQSSWLRTVHGSEDGPPPPVDLDVEKRAGGVIRALIADGLVSAVHDVSDGGAAVALAEMALAGGIGATVRVPDAVPNPAALVFGEDQGRYIVTTRDVAGVTARANAAKLFAAPLGVVGGDALTFDLGARGQPSATLDALRSAHEGFFPALMGEDAALA